MKGWNNGLVKRWGEAAWRRGLPVFHYSITPLFRVSALVAVLLACGVSSIVRRADAQIIGNHAAVYDEHGVLQPWTAWRDALSREVNWYLKCPWTNAYPRFVVMTFTDGNYNPRKDRPDFIPAMQNGMGIISYLKYYAWSRRKDRRLLD